MAVLGLGHTFKSAIAICIAVVPALVGGIALRSLGDAARYLTESPDNIGEREEIRRGLIHLLRELQSSTDPVTGRPTYERVVVIGHSLGSVIAYDAITTFWTESNQFILFPDRGANADELPLARVANDLEEAAKPLWPDEPNREGAPSPEEQQRLEWWRQQQALQESIRTQTGWKASGLWRQPGRWIISDLVTVGSPLTYAEILLANGSSDLRSEQQQRFLFTCPPVSQVTTTAACKHPLRYRAWRGSSYATKLHHAACFAPTRWTNIYFSNDLVGGPLGPRFGSGLRDIGIGDRHADLWWSLRDYPHSSYWRSGDSPPRGPTAESIEILRSIVLRQHPVVVVIGTPRQVRDLRGALSSIEAHPGPSSTPGEAPERDSYFELRVLRKSSTYQPVRAWTWMGSAPWYPSAALKQVVQAGTSAGMTIKFASGVQQSGVRAAPVSESLPT